MDSYKNQRGLTLIEIILSVAVLAVVGIFVAQLFVAAGSAARKARDLDQAVIEAQNAVEIYKMFGSFDPEITDLSWGQMGKLFPDAGRFEVYYDKNWQEVGVPLADGFTLSFDLSLPKSRGVLDFAARDITVRVVKLGTYAGEPSAAAEVEIFRLEAVGY